MIQELLRDLEASKRDPKFQKELIDAGYTLLHRAVISNNYDKVVTLIYTLNSPIVPPN